MTNLEEFNSLCDTLSKSVELFKEDVGLMDSKTVNLISLNLVLSTYLSSIAKSLAIIADKMSEKDKEEYRWFEKEYKEPKDE